MIPIFAINSPTGFYLWYICWCHSSFLQQSLYFWPNPIFHLLQNLALHPSIPSWLSSVAPPPPVQLPLSSLTNTFLTQSTMCVCWLLSGLFFCFFVFSQFWNSVKARAFLPSSFSSCSVLHTWGVQYISWMIESWLYADSPLFSVEWSRFLFWQISCKFLKTLKGDFFTWKLQVPFV